MKTILVVDDEQSILDLTAAMLRKFKFLPVQARDTESALERLKGGTIDAALVDIIMPGRGGVDLLMEIHNSYPQLPVIVMSGKIQTSAKPFTTLASQFGARAILPKPFTADELLATIGKALPA